MQNDSDNIFKESENYSEALKIKDETVNTFGENVGQFCFR